MRYSILYSLNSYLNESSLTFKFQVSEYLGISADELDFLIKRTLEIANFCGDIGYTIGTIFFGESGGNLGRALGEIVGLIISVGYTTYKLIFSRDESNNVSANMVPV